MAIRQPRPSRAGYPSEFHGRRMGMQQYLALPEEKPYLEYIAGVVEQKPMVNASHRRLVRKLDALFDRYIDRHGGDAGPEGRVALVSSGNYQLPDTAYWAPRQPSGDDSLPTIAVEVRSPGQSLQSLREKCAAYLRDGVRECWLIDPEARTVERLTEAIQQRLESAETLATEHMPGFEVSLPSFFALLDK